MAYDLFKSRMNNLSKDLVTGDRMVSATNMIQNKTFRNDQNYRVGMLYDWDQNPLEEVEFKWEKIKTHHAEGVEVEYFVHFRPDYNPEFKFKEMYHKDDDIERLGFYIDIWDTSKEVYEKWILVGKDDRVAFDRYNAFKCNWYAEWVYEGEYHKCLGCVRPAVDSGFASSGNDKLGGSTVDGQMSITLPTSENTMTILLGTKFVISDNLLNPQTFQVTKITDTQPFGVTRLFVKQRVFNPHTDVNGVVNEMTTTKFVFDLPLEDLPREYGGQYHRICDCIVAKGLPTSEPMDIEVVADHDTLIINGSPVTCTCPLPDGTDFSSLKWGYSVDGITYSKEDLEPYFLITENDNEVSIKAVNKVMAKYILTVFVKDESDNEYSHMDLEIEL